MRIGCNLVKLRFPRGKPLYQDFELTCGVVVEYQVKPGRNPARNKPDDLGLPPTVELINVFLNDNDILPFLKPTEVEELQDRILYKLLNEQKIV
ncbi:MAG: hypothetical protein BWX84_00009 [Verrucomicrobia bacterium ADurb.Bin118]|jgi:hypothetical protein|nr:MAG: hypothetical protein BWX84_00009 [Verrucomicrobia bacterium ADurb.Bin118]